MISVAIATALSGAMDWEEVGAFVTEAERLGVGYCCP